MVVVVVADVREAEAEADLQGRQEHAVLHLLHEEVSVPPQDVRVRVAPRMVHPDAQHRAEPAGDHGQPGAAGRALVPLHHPEVNESF